MNRRRLAILPFATVLASCRIGERQRLGYCADEKVTLEEFEDLLWNQVSYSAKQAHSDAIFACPQKCIDEYKNYEHGAWFGALVRNYMSDIRSGLNPCNFNHHNHFARNYYFCVHKAGDKAAKLARNKSAITHTEFLTAIKQVKACMEALAKQRTDVHLGHLCG